MSASSCASEEPALTLMLTIKLLITLALTPDLGHLLPLRMHGIVRLNGRIVGFRLVVFLLFRLLDGLVTTRGSCGLRRGRANVVPLQEAVLLKSK